MEDGERSLGNLVLLELTDLLVRKFRLGEVEQFTEREIEGAMGGRGVEMKRMGREEKGRREGRERGQRVVFVRGPSYFDKKSKHSRHDNE